MQTLAHDCIAPPKHMRIGFRHAENAFSCVLIAFSRFAVGSSPSLNIFTITAPRAQLHM